ncbi:hypothetical protein IW140_004818 [Coemansia sp. RSA 1813]|nr:hypothetical protein LPJ74_005608 [Coemansia sp. RSA 1843]KAJ2088822.1 hypothetical protein IW138_003894 [Coemansia sp. RSA 986]KAJ2212348.1 hypothetical protein EV179_004743 [Coemansia sp. RSA 487]KAJ2566695.1 hypothetical protein IW140_004818 [Coemansia sp. RSA 1813]
MPGRTTGVLSSGVVPYPNDPMIPRDKYFKPRGLEKAKDLARILFNKTTAYKVYTDGFMLVASPWNTDEHPRDHNGLRLRHYRVAAIASKKSYSKKAYPRWQAMRTLRLAAALVLPDKGLKRCDYVFVALEKMRRMSRDQIYLLVDKALVDMERKIERNWTNSGRGKRTLADYSDKSVGGTDSKNDKILNVSFGDHHERQVRYISDIIEDIPPREAYN